MNKFKSILCILLSIVILSASIPFVFSADREYDFVTSDIETSGSDRYFYIDEISGFAYEADAEGGVRNYLTDYAVDSIAYFNGSLFTACGNKLFAVKANTGYKTEICTVGSDIKTFAVVNEGAYLLVSGNILFISFDNGSFFDVVIGKKIKSFWLDSDEEISYMIDDIKIYTLNLNSGDVYSKVNFASYYDGDIMVFSGDSKNGNSSDGLSLVSLQTKFPADKYWNHVGMSSNNQDGYTSSPCPSHASTATCNCFTLASCWQCFGYSYKCGYDTSGSNPRNWTSYTTSSHVDDVKAGDIIRYKNDGHSIFVTAVNGNTITYTDCNGDGHCKIRWNATVSKSTVKSSFTFLRVNPANVTPGSSEIGFTVSFDANSGSVSPETKSVKSGETIGELPVPERTGYRFLGWYTSATGGTEVKASNRVTSNMTVYAHWEILVYTVNYDGNGNGDRISNVPASQTKKYGETLTLNLKTPTRTGYKFIGWTADKEGTGVIYNSSNNKYLLNEDVTFYAQWEGLEFTINFNANGGTVNPSSKKVNYGSAYGSLPTPVRSGYGFDGWYTTQSGGSQVFDTTIMTNVGNITLYAHWGANRCTVTYDANGGTGAPSAQTKSGTSNITLSREVPTNSGYKFLSWNTQADGSGTSYKPGDVYSGNDSMVLYAIWDGDKYTVTYNPNGGSGGPTAQYKTQGISLVISSDIPTMDDKAFVCWNTKPDGTGYSYTPGSTYSDNANITLYAQWNSAGYMLRYDLNGGNGSISPVSFEFGNSVFVTSEKPERDGYTFKGWNTSPDGSGESFAPGSSFIPNQSVVLFAVWSAKTYVVRYSSDDGSVPSSQIKEHDVPLKITTSHPIRAGYTFETWNTEKSGAGVSYAPGDDYIENSSITLYARWIANEYAVTFDADGGEVEYDSAVYTFDNIYGNLPKANKVGYSFAGWQTPEGIIVRENTLVKITSASLFIAKWIPNSYVVLFNAGEGSCETISKSVTYSSAFGELPVPVRNGYTFAGWFDKASEGNQITSASRVNTASDITLYACWIPKTETVVFNANGGELNDVSKAVTFGSVYGNLPEPTRKGFTFAGWYSSAGSKVEPSTVCTVSGVHTLNAKWNPVDYQITFSLSDSVKSVSYLSEIGTLPSVAGNGTFCGWYDDNGNKIDENIVYTYTDNIKLTPVFVLAPSSDTIRFVANGVIVSDKKIGESAPAVPSMSGYSGNWEIYDSSKGGQVVNAVYMPNSYTLTVDGVDYSYNFGEKIGAFNQTAPAGYVAVGYDEPLPDIMPAKNVNCNSVYKPITYTAEFIASGKSVAKIQYTAESAAVTAPEVPDREAYTGKWQNYTVKTGDMTVFAEYTPIDYTVTFVADGKIISTALFNVESVEIDYPDAPQKVGYKGTFEKIRFTPGDKTVNAVYNPKTYMATFIADGIKVDTVPFVYGSGYIDEPDVPVKEGYEGRWSDYLLPADNITVSASYKPIEYTISFVANGTLVSTEKFTVETIYINEPEIPGALPGEAYWENYTLTAGNKTINAIYKSFNVYIVGYKNSISVDYKSTIIFNAASSENLSGSAIHWYVNGVDVSSRGNNTYIAYNVTESFTIKAVLVSGGRVISESDTETVNVKTNFFARIIALFRSWMNKLPVLEQGKDI